MLFFLEMRASRLRNRGRKRSWKRRRKMVIRKHTAERKEKENLKNGPEINDKKRSRNLGRKMAWKTKNKGLQGQADRIPALEGSMTRSWLHALLDRGYTPLRLETPEGTEFSLCMKLKETLKELLRKNDNNNSNNSKDIWAMFLSNRNCKWRISIWMQQLDT